MTSPLNREKDSSYYDILRKNEWKQSAGIGPSSRSRYRILIRLMKKHNLSGSLLDCGCGAGVLLTHIHKMNRFKELSGSDFSEEAVLLAKMKGHDVFQADLTKIETFSGKKFDVIICSEVIEHIMDDNLALNNLYKLLLPQGRLLVTVPYSNEYWSQHDDFSGHVRRYSAGELKEKISSANFQIVEYFIWGRVFYALYHKYLIRQSPRKIMNYTTKSKLIIKKIGADLLFLLFFIEDLFISKKKGRRIFLVAEVMNDPDHEKIQVYHSLPDGGNGRSYCLQT